MLDLPRCLLLLLLALPAAGSAVVAGKLAPDGRTEIVIDLPESQHLKNKGGSDRAGLCVFTSVEHSARWSECSTLIGFRDWMTAYPGGGWPQKLTEKIKAISAERKVPLPDYIQIQGGRELLPVLRAALESGRLPAVTYSRSPTGRYNGQTISHMVNLSHLDDKYAAILDNNYPGETAYEWMTVDQFVQTFTGGKSGWAVILLNNGPPPFPYN